MTAEIRTDKGNLTVSCANLLPVQVEGWNRMTRYDPAPEPASKKVPAAPVPAQDTVEKPAPPVKASRPRKKVKPTTVEKLTQQAINRVQVDDLWESSSDGSLPPEGCIIVNPEGGLLGEG